MPTTSVSGSHLRRAARATTRLGRRDLHLAVRDDLVLAVAVVDGGLEDLDLLPRNLRAPQPPDQLLALAAEHAAGDDFDPARMEGWSMTRRSRFSYSAKSSYFSRLASWSALDKYSPVSVLIRMTSPTLTNAGTCTTRPVSSVAGLTCAAAVAPLMPGHGVDHLQIDRLRQLDADRLGLVELDADERLGQQVQRAVAQHFLRCAAARTTAVFMKWNRSPSR